MHHRLIGYQNPRQSAIKHKSMINPEPRTHLATTNSTSSQEVWKEMWKEDWRRWERSSTATGQRDSGWEARTREQQRNHQLSSSPDDSRRLRPSWMKKGNRESIGRMPQTVKGMALSHYRARHDYSSITMSVYMDDMMTITTTKACTKRLLLKLQENINWAWMLSKSSSISIVKGQLGNEILCITGEPITNLLEEPIKSLGGWYKFGTTYVTLTQTLMIQSPYTYRTEPNQQICSPREVEVEGFPIWSPVPSHVANYHLWSCIIPCHSTGKSSKCSSEKVAWAVKMPEHCGAVIGRSTLPTYIKPGGGVQMCQIIFGKGCCSQMQRLPSDTETSWDTSYKAVEAMG